MEWLFWIYVGIGVVRGLAAWGNPNPGKKPLWMSTERNPLTWALYFALYVFIWPLARR